MHLQYIRILLTYFFHKINQGRKVVTISIYKSITGESTPRVSFALAFLCCQEITVKDFRFPEFQRTFLIKRKLFIIYGDNKIKKLF